jgi:transcriptional regulator with XRE-family HTH domain
MDGAQCRMARAAVRMGVRELAEAAKVAPSTITRLEAGETLGERTVAAIRAALEAAGVVFDKRDGAVCVKMEKKGNGSEP